MRLTIPLTGTVLAEDMMQGVDGLVGDTNDPIRPIDIDLGNVSWQLVNVDLNNEVMIIEVIPAEKLNEDTGQVDPEGNPVYNRRPATEAEKQGFLQNAQNLIENHTKSELYEMSSCPRLKKRSS